MSDPVVNTWGNTFIYYTCDRDPTSDEPLVYNNYPLLVLEWLNSVTNDFFIATDITAGAMVWRKITFETDLPWTLPQGGTGVDNLADLKSLLGINTAIPRSYSSLTLAVNTPRTPSMTNDVFVTCGISMSLTLLQSSVMNVQINPGSGFTTLIPFSLSGLAITQVSGVSFIVPSGSSYQITSSGSGTNAITNLRELLL